MKEIKGIIINLIFAGIIWLGFFQGIEGALNIAYFIVWFAFISSLGMLTVEGGDILRNSRKNRVIPYQITIVFDIIVAGVFIWFGGIVTGSVYVLHILIVEYVAAKDI